MYGYAFAILRFIVSPAVCLLVVMGAFVASMRLENDIPAALFAFCGIAMISAIALLLSNRAAFSIYIGLGVAILVAIPSMIKARMTGMSVHSFDLALIFDLSMWAFLLNGFGGYVLPVLAAGACIVAFMALIYHVEQPTRMALLPRTMLIAAPVLLYPLARPAWASDQSYLFHGRHISGLMASLEDLPRLWTDHPVASGIEGTGHVDPYEEPFICGAGAHQPDIIVVHAESQLPPEWMSVPAVAGLQKSFLSQDGKLRELGVETYGGGSWITVSSILTGMSGADFGWMRQFMSKSLVGNVSASVPEILAKCGYRTTALLGMGYDQFSLGPLMTSLGVSDVHDPSDMGIDAMTVRDSRYFDHALARLQEYREIDQRPQFIYVETMFAHSPYDDPLEPDVELEGAPFSFEPVENEYLRRLVIARRDIEAFKSEIANNAGARGTIVLEYGDHRPMIELGKAGIDLTDWKSDAYQTYFSFNAYGSVGWKPTAVEDRMDAAYLGYWLIEAAGIAHGGVVDDMRQLRARCLGRFHLCVDRRQVNEVLLRRVNSNLLRLPSLLSSMRQSSAK
jgi:hypothetical protein